MYNIYCIVHYFIYFLLLFKEKLIDAQDDIWNDFTELNIPPSKPRDLLLIGALEAAFREMVNNQKF